MAKMTGRERLLATIRHEEPDRVPISPRVQAWQKAEGWNFPAMQGYAVIRSLVINVSPVLEMQMGEACIIYHYFPLRIH